MIFAVNLGHDTHTFGRHWHIGTDGHVAISMTQPLSAIVFQQQFYLVVETKVLTAQWVQWHGNYTLFWILTGSFLALWFHGLHNVSHGTFLYVLVLVCSSGLLGTYRVFLVSLWSYGTNPFTLTYNIGTLYGNIGIAYYVTESFGYAHKPPLHELYLVYSYSRYYIRSPLWICPMTPLIKINPTAAFPISWL